MDDLRMYYHSYDAQRSKWVIGTATSKDGVAWRKEGPMFWGGGHAFDAHGASAHHIVQDFASKRCGWMASSGVTHRHFTELSVISIWSTG